jgi:hypothetical protein
VTADQYRATMMIAVTMIAAISASARSKVFERCPLVVASSGGMTGLPCVHLLSRPASFCKYQSVMVGRSTEKAGFFQRLGSPCAGRHLARFLKGVRRSRALIAVISGDSAFLLLAHLSGRLELAAKPAANVGLHGVFRCRRRLDATAFLALECPAVEAGGSALDPKEKHSRVIAQRTARPLDRGEVGWVDRLIFRHGTSPRRRLRTLWSSTAAETGR